MQYLRPNCKQNVSEWAELKSYICSEVTHPEQIRSSKINTLNSVSILRNLDRVFNGLLFWLFSYYRPDLMLTQYENFHFFYFSSWR